MILFDGGRGADWDVVSTFHNILTRTMKLERLVTFILIGRDVGMLVNVASTGTGGVVGVHLDGALTGTLMMMGCL